MQSTEWAVVLELATDGPLLTQSSVERVIEMLRDHQASALHNPDRYALQIVVEADGPVPALQEALALHADAIETLRLPVWCLVRTEVMTLQELARGSEEPHRPWKQ